MTAVELDEAEQRRIDVFLRASNKLLKANVFTEDMTGKLSLSGKLDDNKGFAFTASLPDEIEVEQLVLRFRPFISEREPASFYSLCNILWRVGSLELRVSVSRARVLFKDALKSLGIAEVIFLDANRTRLVPEDIIDFWFNADYFHADEDKERGLRKLNAALSDDFTKFALVVTVMRAGHAVALLRQTAVRLRELETSHNE